MSETPVNELATAAVLSLITGVLFCKFSEMQAAADVLIGSSTYTHQFAHQPFLDEMKAALIAQHPALAGVDATGIGTDNWQSFLERELARLGPTLLIRPMGTVTTYAEAFREPLSLIGTKDDG
jgi:hypothetical protein